MSAYEAKSTEGLRNLAQSLEKAGQPPLRCPKCNAELHIQHSAINDRWAARHPRFSTCELSLACWGNATSEEALREEFLAGAEPRLSNPATVLIVQQQIARLCLINDRKNNRAW